MTTFSLTQLLKSIRRVRLGQDSRNISAADIVSSGSSLPLQWKDINSQKIPSTRIFQITWCEQNVVVEVGWQPGWRQQCCPSKNFVSKSVEERVFEAPGFPLPCLSPGFPGWGLCSRGSFRLKWVIVCICSVLYNVMVIISVDGW